MTHACFAGPLRDWIAEKKALNHQDSFNEEDDSSMGKSGLPRGVKLISDMAYGPDEKQRMDVYIPAMAKGAPVIFMVHGGAWRVGDKAGRGVVENKVARWVPKGIIFISANYRLLPGADPLVQAGDIALAMAKAQANAEKWGGDPAKFVLMGHSAGAHLVSLVSANPL